MTSTGSFILNLRTVERKSPELFDDMPDDLSVKVQANEEKNA